MKSLELTSVVDVLGRAPAASHASRVLVLASYGPLRSLLATLLRAERVEPVEVGDTADALDQIAHALVDGELHRPLDGAFCTESTTTAKTLSRLARLHAADPRLPVVLLAKRPASSLEARAKKLGVRVLPLPMPPEALPIVLSSFGRAPEPVVRSAPSRRSPAVAPRRRAGRAPARASGTSRAARRAARR